MNNYDVICITGMPRSGTSFILKIFQILQICKIKNIKENLITLCLDEPDVIGKYFDNGKVPVSIFKNIYDEQKIENYGIIVYKHPQAIFVNSIPDQLKVKYIYCLRRNYEEWKKSSINMGLKTFIDINSQSNWIKNNWPNNWNIPQDINDRIKTYYEMYKNKIENELKKNDSILFEFEDSKKSINLIFDFLGFNFDKSNNIYSILWEKK